jgi:hypothetical protein
MRIEGAELFEARIAGFALMLWIVHPIIHVMTVVFQKWRWSFLPCPSKGRAVDKQAKNDVVHLRRF